MSRSIVVGVLAGLVLIGTIGVILWKAGQSPALPNASSVDRVGQARRALKSGRLADAASAITQALASDPADSRALLLAGEVAIRQEDYDRASGHLQAISASAGADYVSAQFTLGEIERSRGRLQQAERYYEAALKADPAFATARSRLAMIQRMTGRPYAAQRHLLTLLDQQALPAEQLAWLANPQQMLIVDDFLKLCRDAAPDDPFPLFGLGVLQLSRGEFDQAQTLLRQGLELERNTEALAALGRCLIEQDDQAGLTRWLSELTDEERQAPEIQYVMGVVAERDEKLDEAATYFSDCLTALPQHRSALHHLGTVLNRLGQPEQAQAIFAEVQLVSRLHSVVESIDPASPGRQAALEASSLLQRLGRYPEARLWAQLAGVPFTPDPENTSTVADRAATIVQQYAGRNVAAIATSPAAEIKPPPEQTESLLFVDETVSRGIDFQYYESPDDATEGRRMFEFPGGGVGVLDYDVDGRPDLYFTQGTNWPVDLSDRQYLDALYRQIEGRFERVDALAGIVEPGFSHGVATGDLNNDGFADVYVANFGANRCFLNNGDGTFTQSESPAVAAADQWTTSCLIADVNRDSRPDVFEVNYVAGPQVDTLLCPTDAGPRVCTPLAFSPSPDRLLLADAAGQLQDETAAAGLNRAGNGLGVVLGNLDDDADLEIFVANDLMENFLWDPVSGTSAARFENQALARGWALGSDGDALACMGVAAGDLDGDEDLDLFVTNYFNEPNNLYLKESGGLAQESSSAYGIKASSLPLLGFGTQTLDADSDGDWDLVVVNGDLDDFAHEGRAFAMRPQLFENLDNRRFRELDVDRQAGYFSQPRRGRGLAKLDWNGDGLCDFAVSQLDTPSALVTNRSAAQGAFVAMRLIGTRSSRDAVGAVVRLTQQGRRWTQQLTAGDGYQASNQRVLLFGGLSADEPADVEITWPSGVVDDWPIPATDRHYVAVEATGLYRL